ncbi:MAG: hypothetical protein WC455_07215 [Dehalococcoidia bacterium]
MADNTESKKERKVEPQVNDLFWFDTSKEMVQSSISNIEKSADKLQTLLGWLWGIYTTGATVGIALSHLSYPIYVSVLIALPSIFLIIAYVLVSVVYSTTQRTFDPKIPSEIEEVHNTIAKRKHRIYKYALVMTIMASIFVAAALATASLTKQIETPDFQAYLHNQDIAITGQIESNTNIIIKVTGANISEEMPYVASNSGNIDTRVPLNTTVDKATVAVQWEDDEGLVHILERTVTQ